MDKHFMNKKGKQIVCYINMPLPCHKASEIKAQFLEQTNRLRQSLQSTATEQNLTNLGV